MLEQFEYISLAKGVDEWQKQEVFVKEHPVIRRARTGDLIRVIRHVKAIDGIDERPHKTLTALAQSLANGTYEEGGLAVQGFRMTLQHKLIARQKEV